MVKEQISVTLDRDLLKRLDGYKKINYPGVSRSAVVEMLLRKQLTTITEIAVSR